MDSELSKKDVAPVATKSVEFTHFEYECEMVKATGNYQLKAIMISDGSKSENASNENVDKVKAVSKKTAGTEDISDAYAIISHVAKGMPQESSDKRLNHAARMLSILQPQNEMEALLYGQFLSLQEAGLKCVHQANHQRGFYHEERLYLLGTKLLAQANATIQALTKYRSGGQQSIQVVHVHNKDGRAIITQNLPQTS